MKPTHPDPAQAGPARVALRNPQPSVGGAAATAHAAANEWRLVLQLRCLFERTPELAMQLVDDPAAKATSLAWTVLAAAREASAAHPDSVPLHAAVASVAMRLGRLELVDPHARKAIELDPRHVPARALLARCLLLAGRACEALDLLNDAIRSGVDAQQVRDALAALERGAATGLRGNRDELPA